MISNLRVGYNSPAEQAATQRSKDAFLNELLTKSKQCYKKLVAKDPAQPSQSR
jgi:hypothetical protein